VTNAFSAEEFFIKIQDTKGIYKEQLVQLQTFNMYILCSSENERQARSFGYRSNNPIEVIVERKLKNTSIEGVYELIAVVYSNNF